MTNRELIENFEKLVVKEREVTRQVLEHIAEIDRRKAYLALGYDGMYAYLTKGLGYSEAAAWRRLGAARVLATVPEVSEKLESGALNLMQLSNVAKLSRQTKTPVTKELLSQLEGQPKAATEQILAEAFQVAPKLESTSRTQRDHSVRLELTLTAAQFAELEKAKGLISHLCPEGKLDQVIVELARQYNRKYEVREKAVVPSVTKNTAPPARRQSVSPSKLKYRRNLRITLKRQVFQRANNCCEYKNSKDGMRCGSRYQPQVDHVIPIAKGGLDKLENLQLLCGRHNREKSDGFE